MDRIADTVQWFCLIGFWLTFSDYEEHGWVEGDNEVIHYAIALLAATLWPVYAVLYLLMRHKAMRYEAQKDEI